MRVMVIAPGPHFSVEDVYNGYRKALAQEGCQVRAFNLQDRVAAWSEADINVSGEPMKLMSFEAAVEVTLEGLRGQIYDFWPDVIVCVSGFFVTTGLLDLLRARRHRTVMIHTESPYEDDRQLEFAGHVDLNVLNDPINLDRYKAVNPHSIYIPHAYDPDMHHAEGRTDDFDFGFVGTAYPSRIALMEQIDFGDARVALAGNWEQLDEGSHLEPYLLHERACCIDNVDTARLYRQSAMSLNLYRKEANAADLVEGWAMGPREVELAACGTFFAREPRPEGDEVFPMLPTVTDPREITDVLAWSRRNPLARAEAAAAARAAISDRTFRSNARQLLAALDI